MLRPSSDWSNVSASQQGTGEEGQWYFSRYGATGPSVSVQSATVNCEQPHHIPSTHSTVFQHFVKLCALSCMDVIFLRKQNHNNTQPSICDYNQLKRLQISILTYVHFHSQLTDIFLNNSLS